jgi:Ser/Thr protein kinase RdoA (MazF antagonist)
MTTPDPTSSATPWPDRAEELARRLYGLEARATALFGDVYRNFLLETTGGARFALKIAPADADPVGVELMLAALNHLQHQALAVSCPRPATGVDGMCLQFDHGHQLFALEWLPGVLLAHAARSPELFRALGHATAQLHRALEGFTHPGLTRYFDWDLRHALAARERLRCIADAECRNQVTRIFDHFEARVAPVFSQLQHGPIHGDLNDYNILVTGDEVTGILDFGDMTTSAFVADVAIAAAYAMFDTPDPFDAATRLCAAYQRNRPLRENELMLVPEMIATRLAFSVTRSAWHADLRPDDAYVLVSEKPAWTILKLLDDAGLDRLRRDIQRACFP